MIYFYLYFLLFCLYTPLTPTMYTPLTPTNLYPQHTLELERPADDIKVNEVYLSFDNLNYDTYYYSVSGRMPGAAS